jgi:hypothetical protein
VATQHSQPCAPGHHCIRCGYLASLSSGYISEHSCGPLALLAALFPDRMLTLGMGEVERMANEPLLVAQRAPRIAELERALDELSALSWPKSRTATRRPGRHARTQTGTVTVASVEQVIAL